MPKLSMKRTKSIKSFRGGVKKTKSRKTSRKSLRGGVKLTKSKKSLRGGIKRKKSRRVLLRGGADGADGAAAPPPLPPRRSIKTEEELSNELFDAIRKNDLGKLKQLIGNLSNLSDSKKREIMDMKKGGHTLLYTAVNEAYSTSNLDMVQFLVDNGANIEDIANNEQNSVLDIVLEDPNPGILEALVKRDGVFRVSRIERRLEIYKVFLKNVGDWLGNDSGNIVHIHENQIKGKPAKIEGVCFNFIDEKLITRK